MSRVDQGAARGSGGVLDAPSADNRDNPKKSAEQAQRDVRCSACGGAYPPEPMVEGLCWY